jgi:hypothetical protein
VAKISGLSRLARRLLPAGLLAAVAQAQPADPSWIEYLHPTASAELAWVENISHTSHEPTRKDATTFAVEAGGSLPRQLAPSVVFVGSGEITSLFVGDYELNNHLAATGHLALQKKFGLGAQAWVLQGKASGGYKGARYDDDSGFDTAAELQLAKRVLPNLRLAATARWFEHDAQSAVFDLNQSTFGFEAQWDLNDRWSLAGSASWLQGDIVANAAWPVWERALKGDFGPVIQEYYSSRPWSVTNLYGPRWVSYNVEADVDLWSATLTYTFTAHAALDVRYSSAFVVNEVGVTYPTDSWSARFNFRF